MTGKEESLRRSTLSYHRSNPRRVRYVRRSIISQALSMLCRFGILRTVIASMGGALAVLKYVATP